MESIRLKWNLKKEGKLYGYRLLIVGDKREYDIEKEELEFFQETVPSVNIVNVVTEDIELDEKNNDKNGSYAEKIGYTWLIDRLEREESKC